ncbi:MAG: hypothetical protein IJV65_07735 [Kiritimatiellae bacterium]|nr:hypothetical protein [Kiritimatiellia bacterium]
MKPTAPAPVKLPQAFAWHHVAGRVPADWEVSRYAVEDRAGRIEWATRRGLEATVGWEPCEREPDRETTMKAFLAREMADSRGGRRVRMREEDFRTKEVGPFLVGWADERLPVQALAYDRFGGKLVRWIFEGRSSERGRAALVEPVVAATGFNDDPATCEYRLFGIRCVLPRDYKIEDMAAFPANAMMAFEGDESHARVTFRRWGLADLILEGKTLRSLYEEVVRTNGVRVESAEPRRICGCEGFVARFSAPREHHAERYFMRRWHNGLAYVWHDRAANRINAFEQVGPKGYGVLPPETVPGLTVDPATERTAP